MNVLLVNRANLFEKFGGDSIKTLKTKEYLEKKEILVDSIQTGQYSKGTVVSLNKGDFSLASHTSGYHNMDIFTALEFSSRMYNDIPTSIKIIGIEIVNPMEFSDELSLEIRNKFEKIVNKVYQIIINETKKEIEINAA